MIRVLLVRVLLVDDEQLVRAGLRMILEVSGDIEVVAEAVDGADAIEQVRRHRPEMVLMDIRMPVMDGLAATRIAALPDAPKIVVLTTFELDEYVHTALEHGAVGFLLKDTPPGDLMQAVRTVAEGNAMLSPAVTKRLIVEFTAGGARRERPVGDSRRSPSASGRWWSRSRRDSATPRSAGSCS